MKTRIKFKYDFRCAPCSPVTHKDLYACALEQLQWGEEQGVGTASVCEHHGSSDGYCPSPLVTLSAMAGVTKNMQLATSVIIIPFHDPLRLAEDIAVLDIISGGRVLLMMAAGYVPSEFEMFGVSPRDRGVLVEECITTLRKAWTGEPFEYRGRQAQVTPVPVQPNGPPIILGGSTKAAARRAARLANGYIPAVPETYAVYMEECARLGRDVSKRIPGTSGPPFMYISEDPDKAWQAIAPYALHETNSYSRWSQEAGMQSARYMTASDADALRQSGRYAVITPEECLALAKELGDGGILAMDPLMGGMPPELSWASLELFADKVLPHLDVDPAPGYQPDFM